MDKIKHNPLLRCFLLCLPLFLYFFFFLPEPGNSAEQKKTIILLESMPVPAVLEHSDWFLKELKVLGYIDGKNINIVRLNAYGGRQRAKDLLESSMQTSRPDLVVTNATLASQVAMPILAREKIPQLFFTVNSPVDAGLITALGQVTGTNITGKAYSLAQNVKIENIMQLIGQLPLQRPIRCGIIYSSYPSSISDVKALTAETGNRDDLVFVPYMVDYRKIPDGIPAMLVDVRNGVEKLEDKVDFWWQPVGPLGELDQYAELLQTVSKHPTVFATTLASVENHGALLFMSPNRESYGRETAQIAHAILTGTEPGTIPPTPPAEYILALNLKTALLLNIVIPSEQFKLAGDHVYQ